MSALELLTPTPYSSFCYSRHAFCPSKYIHATFEMMILQVPTASSIPHVTDGTRTGGSSFILSNVKEGYHNIPSIERDSIEVAKG